MYIGNSLSMCVKDILQGKMEVGSVACIIAASRFPDMDTAIKHYSKSYWKDFNYGEILAVMRKIWPRTIQPRMWDEYIEPNTFGQERWIIANIKDMNHEG
jgi:hypothetical protein